MPLVKSLQGLRFLCPIHHRPKTSFERLEKDGMFLWTNFHSTHLDVIRRLATLPLTWVKLIRGWEVEMWTQPQLEKYAGIVRTRLLAVDGAGLLQQDESVVAAGKGSERR